jgi:hypothetical protein
MGPAIVLALAPAAAGLTTAGGLTLAGSIVAGLIDLGVGFGLSQLFAPKAPKIGDNRTVFRQSVFVRSKHYGLKRCKGNLLLIKAKDNHLYEVNYYGQGEIEAYVDWYIDDRHLQLDAFGFATQPPFIGSSGNSRIQVVTRLGTPDQTAFEELIDALPEIITANFRARGCVVALLSADSAKAKTFSKVYPNRFPTLTPVQKANKVFDPRTGTRLWSDPAGLGANPGQNLPLILRDYIVDPEGAQVPASLVDDDDFIIAANHAEEIIPAKSGPGGEVRTVRRYFGEFGHDLDSEPGENVTRLMMATCGRLYLKPTGKIGFMPGRWHEPDVHLFGKDLIGWNLEDQSGPLSDANEVNLRYTNPNARYSEALSAGQRDEASLALGARKNVTIPLPEVQNHNHAQRVCKLQLRRRSPRWQGTVRAKLAALRCMYKWTVRLTIEDEEIFGETFEILSIGIDRSRPVPQVVMRVATLEAEAFAFDPEVEEGDPPVDPVDIDPTGVPAPVFKTPNGVRCEQRTVAAGVSVPVIIAEIEEPDRDDLDPEFDISIADAEAWVPMTLRADELSAEAVAVIDRQLYDVRVAFRSPAGETGNFTVFENVLAIADANAPPTPVNLDVVITGTTADVSVEMAFSDNTTRVQFRHGTRPQSFEQASIASTQQAAGNDERKYRQTGLATGKVHRWWAAALNGSNIASLTPAGPVERVIPGIGFTDNFDRADENVEGNANWTRNGGTAGAAKIIGQAVHATLAGTVVYTAPDTHSDDCFARAHATYAAGSNSFIVAIVQDSSNYVAARQLATGSWQVSKRVGPTTTSLQVIASSVPPLGTLVELIKRGGSVTLKVGGVVIGSTLSLSGDLAGATKPGFIGVGATGALLDGFEAGIP